MLKYKLNFSLVNDWVRFLKDKLSEWGYTVPDTISAHDIGIQYFNLLHRRVPVQSRKVLYSKQFSCPHVYKKRLRQINKLIEKGGDMNRYLSRGLRNLQYDDQLLNDWGVYHLHLGKKLETDGYVKRTGPLLYAMFDSTTAYFINIMEHGDWAKQSVMEIVHNNWPHKIEHWKVPGAKAVSPNPTENERLALRKSGMVSFLQMSDGTIYGPPGGGYASDGTSVKAVMSTNHVLNTLRRTELFIKENNQQYIEEIEQQGKKIGNKMEFGLRITTQGSFIVEKHSSIFFPIDI